jgi:hypothetical protein
MKSIIFWDVMPCSLLNVSRSFGGIYRLHLQDRRISLARKQRESRWQTAQALLATCFHNGFFFGLFSDFEDGGDIFLPKIG